MVKMVADGLMVIWQQAVEASPRPRRNILASMIEMLDKYKDECAMELLE